MLDVLISGGGIGGLALAVALRETFGPEFKVAVADPVFGVRDSTIRASALTAASRNLLEAIRVWQDLAPMVQPIRSMEVTDSRLRDAFRPPFLNIDEPLGSGEPFAFMIRNDDLIALLEQKVIAGEVSLIPHALSRFTVSDGGVDALFADGQRKKTRLLVGADGAQSRVRRSCGIETVDRDYRRSAIVATIAHEEEHDGRAVQHFLPAGSFAMLPLPGKCSSIVWTERHDDAAALIRLSDDDFLAELETRFGFSLGRMSLLDLPRAFALRGQLARRFISRRIALIGDAAHVVHPLAGQGLNLGLRDVAALVTCLARPVRLGLDPGQEQTLNEYQRARFFDSAVMLAATDSLHRLFSNDYTPVRLLRDLGLGLINRAPGLKRTVTREAAGLDGQIPHLLRGRLP